MKVVIRRTARARSFSSSAAIMRREQVEPAVDVADGVDTPPFRHRLRTSAEAAGARA